MTESPHWICATCGETVWGGMFFVTIGETARWSCKCATATVKEVSWSSRPQATPKDARLDLEVTE